MDNWQSTGSVDEYVSWIGANLTHGDFYTSNQTQKWCAPAPCSNAASRHMFDLPCRNPRWDYAAMWFARYAASCPMSQGTS